MWMLPAQTDCSMCVIYWLLYPSDLSSNQANCIDKNNKFTCYNLGADLLLPQSDNLFVPCCFNLLKTTLLSRLQPQDRKLRWLGERNLSLPVSELFSAAVWLWKLALLFYQSLPCLSAVSLIFMWYYTSVSKSHIGACFCKMASLSVWIVLKWHTHRRLFCIFEALFFIFFNTCLVKNFKIS